MDRNPSSLSGGEKQRVAIGRALLCSPELLLLDEPFSAIDNDMRQMILPYLKKIQSVFHIPMLIVSHHLPDLHILTKDILLIENGRLKARGKADEVVKICNCAEKKQPNLS
jgi:molybdate transport system ATP-binding protein